MSELYLLTPRVRGKASAKNTRRKWIKAPEIEEPAREAAPAETLAYVVDMLTELEVMARRAGLGLVAGLLKQTIAVAAVERRARSRQDR